MDVLVDLRSRTRCMARSGAPLRGERPHGHEALLACREGTECRGTQRETSASSRSNKAYRTATGRASLRSSRQDRTNGSWSTVRYPNCHHLMHRTVIAQGRGEARLPSVGTFAWMRCERAASGISPACARQCGRCSVRCGSTHIGQALQGGRLGDMQRTSKYRRCRRVRRTAVMCLPPRAGPRAARAKARFQARR